MTRPRHAEPPPPLRLFAAIYPPLALARRWVEAAARLDLPQRRPTPPEQVHLTPQFIGPVERHNLAAVRESVERAASGLSSFVLSPETIELFPSGERPRLVALRTDAPPTLLELKRRLATRLSRGGRENPADAFLPHLTLARFPHPARASMPAQLMPDAPFPVEHVRLMSSLLHPSGPEHRELCRVPLLP